MPTAAAFKCISSSNDVRTFASYANLKGTITHGMFSSAAVRSLVETWAAENNIGRVRSFSCSFVGMVLPNDDIKTMLHHVGMVSGRKIIRVESFNVESEEKVLVGEAEVEQPVTAYVFTGQGSQYPGMGAGLFRHEPIFRRVMEECDALARPHMDRSIIDVLYRRRGAASIHDTAIAPFNVRMKWYGAPLP